MKNTALLVLGSLVSTTALAGGPPSEPIPIASDLGMIGIALVLGAFAARVIARRARRQGD